eukprot:s1091_g2.t1
MLVYQRVIDCQQVLQLLLDPQQPELLDLDRDAWPSALALDLWRCSPLHRAAERGRSEVACYLLTKKADPQKADREGNSPLHFACASGCAPLVAELLKRKVPLDFANNDGYSPLDLCVRKKQPEVGDQLVAAGAKMDVKKTPPSMFVAAASGLPFYCSYIFKSDERVLKKDLQNVDSAGRSPLLLAIQLNHQAVVERLLDHPLCTDDLHKVVASCGLAPLHQAAQAGRMEILQTLLRRKAQVDQVDASGSTALFHAAEAQQLEMLQYLLSQGLHPEHCNDSEKTALHAAAQQGTLEACRALLRAAADSEALIKSQELLLGGGVTPLQLAADLGHQEVLQLLLSDLRSDGEALRRALAGRQGDGRGAWLVACSNGQLLCARQLREAAEAQGMDLTKRKAMTLAALGGHLELCKWLLETGADVKERDSCQWTPLHAASAEGHTEVPTDLRDRVSFELTPECGVPETPGVGAGGCREENELRYPPNIFDLVVLRETLMYLDREDKAVILRKIKQLLRPGGRLVVLDYCAGQQQLSENFQDHIQRWHYDCIPAAENEELLKNYFQDLTASFIKYMEEGLENIEHSLGPSSWKSNQMDLPRLESGVKDWALTCDFPAEKREHLSMWMRSVIELLELRRVSTQDALESLPEEVREEASQAAMQKVKLYEAALASESERLKEDYRWARDTWALEKEAAESGDLPLGQQSRKLL